MVTRKTDNPSRPRLPVVATLVAALLLVGCWQSRQGPAPPDLATQNEEVDQTILRLKRIEDTMTDELDQLRRAREAFFDVPDTTWSRPFPLDAFKHTAMSCLNAPYTASEPEPAVQETAERLGIACAVPAVRDLEEHLAAEPTRRAIALEKIQEVDQMRDIRMRMQSRLRQLPAAVRRTRAYLVSRRQEARQMEKDIQRRQPEYRRRELDQAISHIDEYRERLNELERTIGEVEQSSAVWARDLGSTVDALYKDLSRLGTR